MFKEYIKDGHIIKATEQVYNIVYKKEGYVPYVAEKKTRKKKGEADVKQD